MVVKLRQVMRYYWLLLLSVIVASETSSSEPNSTGKKISRRLDETVEGPVIRDVDDLRRLSVKGCRVLSADFFDGRDPEICAGLTSACLGEFDATDLPLTCSMAIPFTTMADLRFKSFIELASSSSQNIFFSLEDINSLIVKYHKKISKLPDTFIAYCARDQAFASTYVSKFTEVTRYDLATEIFHRPFVTEIDPYTFKLLVPETLRLVPPASFAVMSRDQLKNIRPEVIVTMTASQMQAISPSHFDILTAETLFFVSKATFAANSVQQAKNLGADPDDIPLVKSLPGPARDLEVIAFRFYVERHACQAAQERIHSFASQAVRDAVINRCSKIIATKEPMIRYAAILDSSASSRMISTTMITTLSTLVSMLLIIL